MTSGAQTDLFEPLAAQAPTCRRADLFRRVQCSKSGDVAMGTMWDFVWVA